MKNIIVEKLEKEIVNLLNELDTMESDTPEYDKQLEKISKLYKTLNEEQKLSLDSRKIEIEQEKINADLTIKKEQLTKESEKIVTEFDIRKEQLKLDEKRIHVEREKTSNDYEIRERQLMDSVNNFKEEMELKNKELDRQIAEVIAERELKLKELRSSSISQYVRVGVEVLSVTAPLIFYGVWMKRGFKFEEEGTITSQTFKGLIGKFKTTR